MIRVKGIVNSPIEEPIQFTSLLVQCITGSLEVLPNSYALIELDETGEYDFTILNGSYRVYANYENSMKVNILGEFSVSDGMNEEFYSLNRLVSNFSPMAPDWALDLDGKWQGLFDALVNDANTRISSINQAIQDGDALVIRDMSTFVNDVLGAQGAAITDQIQAGNAQVLAQSKAYTDTAGNEIASNVTEVRNSLATVSQQLTTYKDETNSTFSQITNRIDTNEANLKSEISAEVNAQTGEMELRIENSIGTEVANIGEELSLIVDDLGNHTAAWQVAATVDDLTSAIGMVNDGVNSIIYLQAESLILTNSNGTPTSQTAPFYVQDNTVYIKNAVIKDLTGDKISSSTSIIAGSGDSQAGMNGLDEGAYSGWRFWAGSSIPSLAPFRVNKVGKVWLDDMTATGHIEATSGSFAGHIEAESGTLNNVVINEDCEIKGTLSVYQIDGAINSSLTKSYLNRSSTNEVSRNAWVDVLTVNVQNVRPYDRNLEVMSSFAGSAVFISIFTGTTSFTWRGEWQYISKSTGKVHGTVPVERTFGSGDVPPYRVELTPPAIYDIGIPADTDVLDFTLRIRSITGDVGYIKVNYDHDGNSLGKKFTASLTINRPDELF